MKILDAHTHNLAASHAVINVTPRQLIDGVAVDDAMLSVGIHPWDTPATDLNLLDLATRDHRVVAIGETGLDTLRGAPLAVQETVFRHHIAIAEHCGKPLIIHCVHAIDRLLHIWRDTAPHRSEIIFHGMGRGARVARQLLDEGFWLSYGKRYNIEAMLMTPDERLLVESDECSAPINDVIADVATARGTNVERLTETIIANTSRLFGNNHDTRG